MAKDFEDFKAMILGKKLEEFDGIIAEQLARDQDPTDDPAAQLARDIKTYSVAMTLLILEGYHHWMQEG